MKKAAVIASLIASLLTLQIVTMWGVSKDIQEVKTELKYMQYRDSMYAIYEMIPKPTRGMIHETIQSESYVDAVHQYLKYKKNYDKRMTLREILDNK